MSRAQRKVGVEGEGIAPHLLPDGGGGTVTGMDNRLRRERIEAVLDREEQCLPGATGEIGAADAAPEQGVTSQEVGTDQEADRAGRMPGGVEHHHLQPLPGDQLPAAEIILADHLRDVGGNAGERPRLAQQPAIVRVDGSGAATGRLHRRHPRQVIRMAVGEQDLVAAEPLPLPGPGAPSQPEVRGR